MPGAASTMAREQGFEDAVKKNLPGIQIVDKRYGWADRAQVAGHRRNMLTAHTDLDAMFASNESSAVGAAQSGSNPAIARLPLVVLTPAPIF